MGLFEAFKKKKSHDEEARLLIEEIGWQLTEEDVKLRLELSERQKTRFGKFWEVHGNALIERYGDRDLPPELLAASKADDVQTRRQHVIRAILEETWLRCEGRCARCHRDRMLTVIHESSRPDPNPSPKLLAAAAESDIYEAAGGPPSGEQPANDGAPSEAAAPTGEATREPRPGEETSKHTSDPKAVAEAKKRRRQRRRERIRRRLRRALAGQYEVLCRHCRPAA